MPDLAGVGDEALHFKPAAAEYVSDQICCLMSSHHREAARCLLDSGGKRRGIRVPLLASKEAADSSLPEIGVRCALYLGQRRRRSRKRLEDGRECEANEDGDTGEQQE